MKRIILHVLLFGVEIASLLILVSYIIGSHLPVQEWAFSDHSQILEFVIGSEREELLKGIANSKLYYATFQGNKLCESQMIADTNNSFIAGSVHKFVLPARVTGFRLDFYPKDRLGAYEYPPVLSKVRIGNSSISEDELSVFQENKYKFSGYRYSVKPYIGGWWRILFPIDIVVLLLLLWVAFEYFRHQECSG